MQTQYHSQEGKPGNPSAGPKYETRVGSLWHREMPRQPGRWPQLPYFTVPWTSSLASLPLLCFSSLSHGVTLDPVTLGQYRVASYPPWCEGHRICCHFPSLGAHPLYSCLLPHSPPLLPPGLEHQLQIFFQLTSLSFWSPRRVLQGQFEGWRGGSLVTGTRCSCRGPMPDSVKRFSIVQWNLRRRPVRTE